MLDYDFKEETKLDDLGEVLMERSDEQFDKQEETESGSMN